MTTSTPTTDIFIHMSRLRDQVAGKTIKKKYLFVHFVTKK